MKNFSTMPRSRIALETGAHSRVSRVLSELGHEAIVAHARNVRLIGESRRKNDRLDAQALVSWPESIRSYWRFTARRQIPSSNDGTHCSAGH
jgi:hypothetical protein